MQGQFPIAPRPYQHVAAEAGITEEEVMAAVTRLLDERIIRQVTPIFDTRALGYSSMLVAAKVDPDNPWRAATIINSHPGVSHNYLWRGQDVRNRHRRRSSCIAGCCVALTLAVAGVLWMCAWHATGNGLQSRHRLIHHQSKRISARR